MATKCKDYQFLEIEPHWQSFWEQNRSFRAEDGSSRPKYYVLDMFPYPSGAGLHIGHPEGYTATDIVARYRRARGENVLHPIGWDAFGLPAEQHAVKTGTHPAANTQANIANFRRQIRSLGFSYDWDREIDTTDPKYFRWTQWIFLQLFRRGLAYVDERPVWWCPELRTVLANEEVVDGRSEVGGFPVERRRLRQWVLRITAYAERLLADLKDLDWPESTKRMQEAWIGRSEGAEIKFALEEPGAEGTGTPAVSLSNRSEHLTIFTTRPDTLFGCTYMVLAPEHALVDALTVPAQKEAVEAYRRKTAAKSDLERTDLAKDKSGVFTGAYAINPVNGARVPVWIADYVLLGYGTGAIMAVPAHDERDHAFAEKYDLPIIPVIAPDKTIASDKTPASKNETTASEKTITSGKVGTGVPARPFAPDIVRVCPDGRDARPYLGAGSLVNSGAYDGLPSAEAGRRITADLAARGAGRAAVTYKLRDWLFSRQRYWGEPFPIVWVSEADYRRAAASAARAGDLPPDPVTFREGGELRCALPLPAAALPLELPLVQSYLPSGTGESALAHETAWLEIWFDYATGAAVPAAQPRPAGDTWVRARRETNTMPQWAGSCWYYLRFADPRNDAALASPAALAYWGVPDLYVGGAEHAVLHLLYSRFWHKVLFDLGVVPQSEPFRRLFHQGIILGEDGEKMSKSRGNVVSPDTIVASHGADTLRLYLMFLGPLEAMKPWNPRGIEGVHRFLQRAWRFCLDPEGAPAPRLAAGAPPLPPEVGRLFHETIRKVGEDIESLRLNTAISQLMTLLNALQGLERVPRGVALAFVQLLAPFAPHLAEELWERLGEKPSVLRAPWPRFDPAKLAAAEVTLVFQVNGRHRGDQLVPVGLAQEAALALAQAHPKVAPHLAGKTVKKIVYVPGKILNVVAVDSPA